jgi:GT2 family glycosyltransferase
VSQNFIALTAACLAVRKDVFDEVNGLNEENLAVAFNDVDFCIKVNQAGYRNLWTPHAVLYHHESASRGKDESPKNIKRFQKEVNYMKIRWKNTLMNDPTYNINLTLDREDLSLAFPPRSKK